MEQPTSVGPEAHVEGHRTVSGKRKNLVEMVELHG